MQVTQTKGTSFAKISSVLKAGGFVRSSTFPRTFILHVGGKPSPFGPSVVQVDVMVEVENVALFGQHFVVSDVKIETVARISPDFSKTHVPVGLSPEGSRELVEALTFANSLR